MVRASMHLGGWMAVKIYMSQGIIYQLVKFVCIRDSRNKIHQQQFLRTRGGGGG